MSRRAIYGLWTTLLLAHLPAAAFDLELTPAWGGYGRPGAATEVNVRVVSDSGGQLTLTAAGGASRSHHELELGAGEPIEVQLPVRLDRYEPIVVEATLGEESRERRTLTPRFFGRPLIVLVTEGTQRVSPVRPSSDSEALLLRLKAVSLPVHPSSYETIAGLILASSVLGQLNTAQLSALQAYLGDCGPLVVLGSTEAMISGLQRSASCRGNNVRSASTLLEALGICTELRRHRRTLVLPSALRDLPATDGSDATQLAALVVFFSGYLIVLLLVSRFSGPYGRLLIAPLAFSGLCLLAWSHVTPLNSTITWAELDSGDAVARFSTVLSIAGRGRVTATVPISGRLGPPVPTEKGQPLDIHQGPIAHLAVDTYLLSRHEFSWHGSVPVDPPLRLLVTASGPQVVNTSQEMSPAGLLIWQGQCYVVPVLKSGMTWVPPEESSAWGSGTLDRLLRIRTSDAEVALLIPYAILGASLVGATDVVGWLLIQSKHYDPS